MGLFSFPPRAIPTTGQTTGPTKDLAEMLSNASIEVTPRTAAKVPDFRAILPAGTRVYIAHIAGTEADDMVGTAARLRAEGMEPVAHLPARLMTGHAQFAGLIARYRDAADLRQALVLGGGADLPAGPFHQARDLMDTGHLDSFERLDIAGHPEGNRDIDPDGGTRIVMDALRDKQSFARSTGCQMGIVTQFVFDAAPVADWMVQLRDAGITLPVHLGLAGPAKLQTLLKYAIACGVGPSLSVLQKRARDMTKLLVPFEPTALAVAVAAHNTARPDLAVAGLHLFPLGGIAACTDWMAAQSGRTADLAQGAQA